YVRSIEIGTTSTSPQSATRIRSKGWTLRTGFQGRISDDCSRTALGPKRAPVRYEVPPSYGMPSKAMSRSRAEGTAGSSMNVAIWPNRGETNASRGPDVLKRKSSLERGAQPELLEVSDRGGQSNRLGDGRGPRLEPPGQVVPLGAVDPHFLDHLAAAATWLEAVENGPPAVHDADAGRAQHLVRREHVEVTSQRGHIDPHVRSRLSPVDDRDRVDRPRPPDDVHDWGDRPQNVGHVGERDHARPRREQTIEGGQVEHAVGENRHRLDDGAAIAGDQLPRDQVRMVLELGDDDLVASLQGPSDGLGDEPEAVGGAVG